jgi:hypothetical protein
MPDPLPVEPKKNRTGIIIAVVVVVLCCCCLFVGSLSYYLYQNGDALFGNGALINSLTAL